MSPIPVKIPGTALGPSDRRRCCRRRRRAVMVRPSRRGTPRVNGGGTRETRSLTTHKARRTIRGRRTDDVMVTKG